MRFIKGQDSAGLIPRTVIAVAVALFLSVAVFSVIAYLRVSLWSISSS